MVPLLGFFRRNVVAVTVALSAAAIAPVGVHVASAQFVPVLDEAVVSAIAGLEGTLAADVAANTDSAVQETSMTVKEIVLDGIVFGLINGIIDQIGDEMVRWIQSGFDGQPGFIQDPGGFFNSISDYVSGSIIARIGSNGATGTDMYHFLCDPVQLPSVRLALSLQNSLGANEQREYTCTASSILNGINRQLGTAGAFVYGDFTAGGGWDQWANMAVRNQNYLGAAAKAQVEIDKRVAEALDLEKTKLDWGQGFLSGTDAQGYINRPGKFVETQLNNTFDSGRNRLEIADEISEMIGAIINLAMQGIMQGLVPNGRTRSYSGSYSGNASFTMDDFLAVRDSGQISRGTYTDPGTGVAGGTIGSVVVSPDRALQGPASSALCGNGFECSANQAVDGNKDQRDRTSAIAISTSVSVRGAAARPTAGQFPQGLPWWRAEFDNASALNGISVVGLSTTSEAYNLGEYRVTFYRTDGRVQTAVTESVIGNPITCTVTYLNVRGERVSLAPSSTCTIPADAAGGAEIKLNEPALVNAVEIRRTNYSNMVLTQQVRRDGADDYWYSVMLALNEVEFFARPAPVFEDIAGANVTQGGAFDPLAGVSAIDADGNAVANITYVVRDPSGTVRAFDSSITGDWTFTYTATDVFNVPSRPVERRVPVTTDTTSVPLTPPIILYGGNRVTSIPASTVASTSSFNLFENVTAQDSRGTIYTSTSIPSVRATYLRDGAAQAAFNLQLTGTWQITYTFTDRLGTAATPVTRIVTVN